MQACLGGRKEGKDMVKDRMYICVLYWWITFSVPKQEIEAFTNIGQVTKLPPCFIVHYNVSSLTPSKLMKEAYNVR